MEDSQSNVQQRQRSNHYISIESKMLAESNIICIQEINMWKTTSQN